MGMGDGCTPADVEGAIVLLAEELDVGYLLGDKGEEARRRKIRVWHRRLRHHPTAKLREAVRGLVESWEARHFPRAKDVERAMRRILPPLGPLAAAHATWAVTLDGPCPVCHRPATWEPRLGGDCDPRAHDEARVPLVACHPWLHALARQAIADHTAWPAHPNAVPDARGAA